MTDSPLVSIVTPVFNCINYLETCLQNVLSQSYPHIEHILVDGGSTDGTVDMLASYGARYPDRIRFISEPDGGVGEALNKGLKMAKGKILGWLDADDIYEPDAVTIAVEFFRSNPEAYYVFGGVNIINETGKVIGEVPIKDFDFKEVVKGNHYLSLSAAFYRREVVEKVGDFNILANNFDYWIRIAQQFKMYRIDRTLCSWRLDSNSLGMSKSRRSVEHRKQKLREDYLLCRQYGGSILAPRCRKYFIFIILNKLGFYPFINARRLFELRRYRFVDWMLRMAGV